MSVQDRTSNLKPVTTRFIGTESFFHVVLFIFRSSFCCILDNILKQGVIHMLERTWSLRLIRLAAVFGVIGTAIGSHMSGAGSYAFRPIHAHILLAGWLSVFAWGVFYRLYRVKRPVLVSIHGWTAVIGSIGLTSGMWLYAMNPFEWNETFTMVYFIIGGTFSLISFILFLVVTFMIDDEPA